MQYSVAVRTLCEFTAKTGDLDLRFTPSPTAQEGIAGHAAVTGSRGSGYEREVALEGSHAGLRVRGRADGWDAVRRRVEEIKTFRGDLARQPANHRALHWAQARVYGWLLCERHGLDELTVALVYWDVGRQKETVLEERHPRAALQAFFEDLCTRFLAWARQEAGHRQARDAALATLAFPHPAFRPGQRELAEDAWRAVSRGRCLLAQAPTGIGKTVGTLFPALKAMPAQAVDKLVFLTAKTPGRQLALDGLARLREGGDVPLRVLELVARDKACEHPDKACHGQSCPLAAGFYDRLPAARDKALAGAALDRARVREVALAHQVCPYYLSQELARWSDVVVGDYHYWLDGSALLHALSQENGWRTAVLADEAHNLLERGREMYSARLDPAALAVARRGAPPKVRRALGRLAKAWDTLGAGQEAAYATHDTLPEDWFEALHQASAAIADHLAEVPHEPAPELQAFWFDALAMLRLAEAFSSHSVFDVTLRPGPRGTTQAVPCIRNLVPAPFLGPRWRDAHAAVLFSATLSPPTFYRETLGLPEDTAFQDVPSPFSPEQLAVRVVRSISTRWNDRARSVDPIVALIAREYRARPGNYLAFFSSFEYLGQVAGRLRALHPDLPVAEQSPGMPEGLRREFVDGFVPGGRCLGFAVLGGSFGEGIDLPGDRLVGAFIATLGLPQVNPVNEEMRKRLDRAFGAGYDYAYLYPGIRKVVQAAGRVIRTREDRGTVVLMDDRFARREVRALLPAWWQVVEEPAPAR